jgi:hypothetical protein
MSATEIERLRDRVAELEYALGLTAIPRDRAARDLSPMQNRLLAALIQRPLVSREAAQIVMWSHRTVDARPDGSNVDAQLCAVRKFLKKRAIEIKSIWGAGWCLDEGDRATLRAEFIRSREAA